MTEFQYARTELLDIAYFDRGNRDGFPVVLLHGWPDDALTWGRVSPGLIDAGFRVIVPYLRGFGQTRFISAETPRSGQLAALGRDVVELADALRLERFALVGHDWGARAAAIATTEVQATGRVSHLAMLSVGYGTNDPNQKLPLQQIQNYWYHWYMSLPRGLELVRDDRKTFTRYIWNVWAPNWKLASEEFDATAASFENPDWFEIVIHSYRYRWGYAVGDPRYADLEKQCRKHYLIVLRQIKERMEQFYYCSLDRGRFMVIHVFLRPGLNFMSQSRLNYPWPDLSGWIERVTGRVFL